MQKTKQNKTKTKNIKSIKLLLLGQSFSRRVCQAVPVGRVCEQVGQYGTQQGERDLLGVQAEDAVE